MKARGKKSAAPGKASGVRKVVAKVLGRDTSSDKKPKKNKDDKSMLREFFEHELRDLYWAEKHLSRELGNMAKKATSVELQEALVEHQGETEGQIDRLERIFVMLEKKAIAKKCEAISGITKEIREIISETKDDTFTRDVALIVGGQKVEHYEIAMYGSLVQLARTLGREDVAELLQETLDEEKNADRLLTQIAENYVNEEAQSEAAEE